MDIGIATFSTDQSIRPEELARAAEERGFSSLFLTDHTHIPVSRETPVPYVYGGGELRDFYKRPYDPFIALTAAATATTTIQLGTGICLVAQRDTIATAKQVASLDFLSDGRFTFGVGFGWNREEAESHGVRFSTRHRQVKEQIAAMKSLWTNEVASFEGDFVQFGDCWAWPKPVQSPHPPIYVGGHGPLAIRHAAEWADAWFPTPHPDDLSLEREIPRFRAAVERAGRDPNAVGVVVDFAPSNAELLDRYREQGVQAAVLRLGTKQADDTIRDLDRLADTVLSRMR
jgi:probable F420-dependent oxidoreductase